MLREVIIKIEASTASVWVEDADFSHGFVVESPLFLASHVHFEPSSAGQVPEIDASLDCSIKHETDQRRLRV